MSSIAEDLEKSLKRLDPDTALLLERFVRDAVALAERRAVGRDAATDAMGYPLGYFESTAGSFANEPLDAPDELPMQAREPW